MKTIIVLLLALFLIGEYSLGEFLVYPPLRYDGMGRANSPIVLYDPSADSYLYIPANAKGKFIFDFQGFAYEITLTLEKNMNIKVYRREP